MDAGTIEEDRQVVFRCRGRPSIPILEAELVSHFKLHFSQSDIAKLFGCSACSIRRQIDHFGLGNVMAYDNISDANFDVIVCNFVLSFPTAGQKNLQGHLRSRGYHIQWWRIRESLLHVDPWAGPLREEIGPRERFYVELH